MAKVTYSTVRPLELAFYIITRDFDARRKVRILISIADAEGRSLTLADETTTRSKVRAAYHSKPAVSTTAQLRPATWTVVVTDGEQIKVRTVPFAAPKARK
jgi:hypothetical protein